MCQQTKRKTTKSYEISPGIYQITQKDKNNHKKGLTVCVYTNQDLWWMIVLQVLQDFWLLCEQWKTPWHPDTALSLSINGKYMTISLFIEIKFQWLWEYTQ